MVRFAVLLIFVVTEISAQNALDIREHLAIDIGGIKQWISIRGTNRQNPVLLFLHGGPGNSAMSYADNFTSELQKKFVVVQWDQRESGKTAELNASGKPLTVALMERDAIEVILYLRTRFSQDKIFLMGHSWGGFLGLMLAAHYPELLHAYVAVCPMVNQLESERQSLVWMMNKAKRDSNMEALRELTNVEIPFRGGDQLFFHRSWLARMMGIKPPSRDFVEDWAVKWLPLYNEAAAVNFFQVAPEMQCPVYFFVGTNDLQTNWEITRDYQEVLKAPEKGIFFFENTGHNLNTKEPKKFQETILKEILPLAGN